MTKPSGDRLIDALIIAAVLAMGGIAWATKADRGEVQRLEAKIDRALDLLCAPNPNARACTEK